MNGKNIKSIYIFVNNATNEMSLEDKKKNFELGIIVYTNGTSETFTNNNDLNRAINETIVSFATPVEKASAYDALRNKNTTKLMDSTLITKVRKDAEKMGLAGALSKLSPSELSCWEALVKPIYEYAPNTRDYYHLNEEEKRIYIPVKPVPTSFVGLKGTPKLNQEASKKHKRTKGKVALAVTAVALAVVMGITGLSLPSKNKNKNNNGNSVNQISNSNIEVKTLTPELIQAQELRKEFFNKGEEFLAKMKVITDKNDPQLEFNATDFLSLYLYINFEDIPFNDLAMMVGDSKYFNIKDLEKGRQEAEKRILALIFLGIAPDDIFDNLSYSPATKELGREVMAFINGRREFTFEEATALSERANGINPIIAEIFATVMRISKGAQAQDLFKAAQDAADRACGLRNQTFEAIIDDIKQGNLEKYGSMDEAYEALLAKYLNNNNGARINMDEKLSKVFEEATKKGSFVVNPSASNGSFQLPKGSITKENVSATPEEVAGLFTKGQIAAADKAAGINNDAAKEAGYKEAQDVIAGNPNIEGPVYETPPPAHTEITETPGAPVIDVPVDGPLYDKDGNIISGGVQAPPTNNAETDAVKDAINNAINDATTEPPKVDTGETVPVQPQASNVTIEVNETVPIITTAETITPERKAALDEVINEVMTEYENSNSDNVELVITK